MEKIKNPYLGKEGYRCICCSPENPIGLHLSFYEDGDDVLTQWRPSENFQGWVKPKAANDGGNNAFGGKVPSSCAHR